MSSEECRKQLCEMLLVIVPEMLRNNRIQQAQRALEGAQQIQVAVFDCERIKLAAA